MEGEYVVAQNMPKLLETCLGVDREVLSLAGGVCPMQREFSCCAKIALVRAQLGVIDCLIVESME